jgi:hypothetical protein
MTFEYFPPIAFPFFAHAGFTFLQCFRKGPSQYNDLLDIQIDNLSCPISIQGLLDTPLPNNPRFYCRDLLVAALIWCRRLRVIGVIPIMLYLIVILLSITKNFFSQEININLLSSILLASAFVLQVLYLIFKVLSKIPELLKLHKNYAQAKFMPILLDMKPLW